MAIQVSGSTVIHDSQDVQVSGMFTASSFVGDASQLTNLPASGGTLEATVSGTLADGDPVVVNANGTVSPISSSGFDAWVSVIGTTDTDMGFGIATDSSGNVYITGYCDNAGEGSNELILVKYSPAGIVQWQRFLGGSGQDRGNKVVVDSSDNVYVCGESLSGGTGALIVKYDSSGAIVWQRKLGGSSHNASGFSIAIDSSDNLYITGSIYYSSQNRVLVAKYNSSGAIQWQRKLNGSNDEYGRDIAVDNSSNVYVFGYTTSAGQGSNEPFIAKYNSSGSIQWQRTLGGSDTDWANGIAVDGSGNAYICGGSFSVGGSGQELIVAKYNTSGVIQWQRTLGGSNSDSAHGIAVDSSGNVYLGGTTYTATAGSSDFLIIKYNSSGTIQWQRTLGGTGAEECRDLVIDSSSIYITGFTTTDSAGSLDLISAKIPISGSGTGTYGSFTYATSSFTDSASSLTDSSLSLSDTTSPTLSDYSPNFAGSDATSSTTSSTTTISSLVQNLTAENYIGISDGAYTNGQTATIQVTGSVDDAQSGLTAGQAYYVQHNGTISETADNPSVFAGTAVSASKIIVKG